MLWLEVITSVIQNGLLHWAKRLTVVDCNHRYVAPSWEAINAKSLVQNTNCNMHSPVLAPPSNEVDLYWFVLGLIWCLAAAAGANLAPTTVGGSSGLEIWDLG